MSPTHVQTFIPKVLQQNRSLLIFHKGRSKSQMHFLYRLGPEHVLLVFKFKNSEKIFQPSHLDSVIDSPIQFTNQHLSKIFSFKHWSHSLVKTVVSSPIPIFKTGSTDLVIKFETGELEKYHIEEFKFKGGFKVFNDLNELNGWLAWWTQAHSLFPLWLQSSDILVYTTTLNILQQDDHWEIYLPSLNIHVWGVVVSFFGLPCLLALTLLFLKNLWFQVYSVDVFPHCNDKT